MTLYKHPKFLFIIICFFFQFYYNCSQSPQMPRLAAFLLILITLTTLSLADQWFMPDSNLISDQQFNSKVVQDKQSFKFIKYFTPHCPYCRYLKAVFDQLKHKKQWCFKVYDFNCQWYPQFCMNHVRSGSFPYTAIHDQQGNMIEQIHGFYPQPIITTIFDRIQERCLAARGIPAASSNHNRVVVPQVVHHEVNVLTPVQKPATIEPLEYHQQPKVQLQTHTPQIKTDIQLHSESQPSDHNKVQNNVDHNQAQKEIKPKAQETHVQEQHTTQQHAQQKSQRHDQKANQVQKRALNEKESIKSQHQQGQGVKSYHNYLFYGLCLLCAGYYVYTLHADKQNPQIYEDKSSNTSSTTASRVQKQVNMEFKQKQQVESQPCVEQSELLKHIPDQEL